MCLQVIYHVYHIIQPQEMTEVTAEIIRHWSRAVRHHISYVTCIHQIIHISSQRRTVILLFTRLSMAVEQHHIMSLALEEIVTVFRFRIPAVTRILYDINSLVKQDKRVCIGMRVIPCMPTLYGKHSSILFPRSTHSSPSEIREKLRVLLYREFWSLA